jgi:hypothetical protein
VLRETRLQQKCSKRLKCRDVVHRQSIAQAVAARRETLFNKMKNNWKKAEISGVISRLLEPKVGSMVSKSDLGQISNEVVAAGWNKHPDIFEGKFGTR